MISNTPGILYWNVHTAEKHPGDDHSSPTFHQPKEEWASPHIYPRAGHKQQLLKYLEIVSNVYCLGTQSTAATHSGLPGKSHANELTRQLPLEWELFCKVVLQSPLG